MKYNRLISSLIAALFLSACATSPSGRSQLMLVSPDQAISASRTAYTEILKPLDKEGKVDSDPKMVKRVKGITAKIVYQATQAFPETRNWAWNIKVIEDAETVNAWCMAGGKMAVYTGLIEQLEPTDDELAQVIAHEVSHALANHTAERMSVAMASQIGIMAVSVATKDSKYRTAALVGAPLVASLAIQLPNSRTAETEADRIGIELAAKAGYNPHAAAKLWQKMGQLDKASPAEFFSTHPAPGNRQKTLAALAPQMMKYYNPKQTAPSYTFKN